MCQEYATRGAYAYVSMIQREERKNKAYRKFGEREGGGEGEKRDKYFFL